MMKTAYEILAMDHEALAKWAAKLQADLFSNTAKQAEVDEAKRILMGVEAEIERREMKHA